MNRDMTILGITDTNDMPKFEDTRLQSINGVEVEPDENSMTMEIFPGEPVTIEYSNGKRITFELKPGVKSMPLEFLANNRNILNAVKMYQQGIKTHAESGEVTDRVKAHYAKVANSMYSMAPIYDERLGNTVDISIEDQDGAIDFKADPIPGIIMNTGIAQTERVITDSNGIITSLVLNITTDFNHKLENDLSKIVQLPEIAAAA